MYGDLYDEGTDTLYADDTTYCVHGTYIGTPGGPDFMCGWCEEGISHKEFMEHMAEEQRRHVVGKAGVNFFQDGVWVEYLRIRSLHGLERAEAWWKGEFDTRTYKEWMNDWDDADLEAWGY